MSYEYTALCADCGHKDDAHNNVHAKRGRFLRAFCEGRTPIGGRCGCRKFREGDASDAYNAEVDRGLAEAKRED